MNRPVVLAAASLLLQYPDARARAAYGPVRSAVAGVRGRIGAELLSTVDGLAAMPPAALAEHYVATFDLRRRCCLYLTWWTEGETRRRGLALARLKEVNRARGHELVAAELPDFLPVVLEFAAAEPDVGLALLQEHRAGLELLRLALEECSTPYAGVLRAVCSLMAQLYSADGGVLASSASVATRRLLGTGQVAAVRSTGFASRSLPLGHLVQSVRVRLLTRRLDQDGGVLAVAVPTDAVGRGSTRQLVVVALAAPLLAAGLAAVGWLLERAALRPVDQLTREAAAISTLDTGRRLPAVPGDDEFARLAATLDGMLGRLAIAFDRERAFVDDASHELRTPLAVLRGEIELALGDWTTAPRWSSRCWPPAGRSIG